jgi:predicted GNAT family acetyltransferase
MTDVSVVNNQAAHRYEAWLGEVLAGISVYTLDDGLITFTHTQVADAFEGKGVASALIRAALDDVRAGAGRKVRPLRVKPLCPSSRPSSNGTTTTRTCSMPGPTSLGSIQYVRFKTSASLFPHHC